ncbi:MAG: hypothetical protein AAF211_20965 [Myxococcota bacterium]
MLVYGLMTMAANAGSTTDLTVLVGPATANLGVGVGVRGDRWWGRFASGLTLVHQFGTRQGGTPGFGRRSTYLALEPSVRICDPRAACGDHGLQIASFLGLGAMLTTTVTRVDEDRTTARIGTALLYGGGRMDVDIGSAFRLGTDLRLLVPTNPGAKLALAMSVTAARSF